MKHLLMIFILGSVMTSWHCFNTFEIIGSSLPGDLLSSGVAFSRVTGTKLASWQSMYGRSVHTISGPKARGFFRQIKVVCEVVSE